MGRAAGASPYAGYGSGPFSASGARASAASQQAYAPWREAPSYADYASPAAEAARYAPSGTGEDVRAPAAASPQAPGARSALARAMAPAGTAANNGYVTITLSANNAAGFSYLFGWLSGIFFYFTERSNRFVRFHAWQSIILTSLFTVLAVLLYIWVEWLTLTPHDTVLVVAGVVGAVLVLLAMFLIWLYTLVAAWTGHYLRLPIIGRIAEHFAVPAQEPYSDSSAEQDRDGDLHA